MHQPEEACSPGVATRLAKRRSMDGAVPSTPPSSGKGKRRDAPSDYRADVSRALDVPAGSSGATDEEMHDRSPRESRSVSSDDADVREDIAAVAREAAVDRKVRVPSARQTPPLSMDDCVSETRERARTKHATSRCFPSVRRTRVDEIVHSRAVFFFFFFPRQMSSSVDPDASLPNPSSTHILTTYSCLFTTHDRRHRDGMTRRHPRRSRGSWGTRNARFSYGRTVSRFPAATAATDLATAATASPTKPSAGPPTTCSGSKRVRQ